MKCCTGAIHRYRCCQFPILAYAARLGRGRQNPEVECTISYVSATIMGAITTSCWMCKQEESFTHMKSLSTTRRCRESPRCGCRRRTQRGICICLRSQSNDSQHDNPIIFTTSSSHARITSHAASARTHQYDITCAICFSTTESAYHCVEDLGVCLRTCSAQFRL